jgi:hypothetical protein
MENNLVHIAISPKVLASLIEREHLHVVDFRCLNAAAKKTVWTLLLSALQSAPRQQIQSGKTHHD